MGEAEHDTAESSGGNDTEDSAPDPGSILFTEHLISCARGKMFFVSLGGLIGLARGDIMAGDFIFIVAGASHPIILRPSPRYEDTYQAIGECYVHGFMDGQALEYLANRRELYDFVVSQLRTQGPVGANGRNPLMEEISGKPEAGWQNILIE